MDKNMVMSTNLWCNILFRDMNFDLGCDFGKLSSFKVDMSDLDFPISSKKATKSKDTSEGESPMGNSQRKKDSFSFSFDFNE